MIIIVVYIMEYINLAYLKINYFYNNNLNYFPGNNLKCKTLAKKLIIVYYYLVQ